MTVENAQFISELNPALPPGSDPLAEGDDHLRVIKQATQQSFPNVDAVVTATAAEMNEQPEKNVAEQLTAEWEMVDTNGTQQRLGFAAVDRVVEAASFDRSILKTDESRIIFGEGGAVSGRLTLPDTGLATDFRALAMCGVLNDDTQSDILIEAINTATLSFADNGGVDPTVVNGISVERGGFVVIWRITSLIWYAFGDAVRT